MATKELINFKSKYEEIDTAWPANDKDQAITKEAETRITRFQKRKLGQVAMKAMNLSRFAS